MSAFRYSVDGVDNSSLVNGSSERDATGLFGRDDDISVVEMYSGVLCTVLLFTMGLIGTLLNIFLLIAGRIKRSVRTLQYGLHYAVCIVNLVFCCVWLPLHAVQVLTNAMGDGAAHIHCFANTALFNLCVALLVFLVFFLAIQRLYQLSSLPAHNIRQTVVRGFVITVTISCVAATALCIEYPWNIDYRLCTEARANNIKIGHLWFSVASILFMVIYSLLLLITMLILWIATLAVRHKIAQMLKPNDNDIDEGGRDTPEHTKSFCSADHTSAATTSSRKESVAGEPPVQKQLMFVEPNKTSKIDSDDEEDDDMFDMKMRMRAQKATSGRRHTVANIGLGDSLFGFGKRRGSLEDNRPKTNYNYVRKWSVDITALQDQLENPKMQGRPMPFGDLTALKDKNTPLKASGQNQSIAEHEEEEEEEEETKSPEQGVFSDETDTEEVQPEPEESDPLATSMEETTAIVVVNGNSPRNHANNRVDFAAPTENDAAEHVTSVETGETSGCGEGLDSETLAKYEREVHRTNQCLVLELVTLLCLLPYTLLQLLQPVMAPQLNRNLSSIAMAASAGLMCCALPPLLVWMDARLQKACHKLRNQLTNWRCVCYCNIGKGKKCFGRPTDMDDASAHTTVIA